MMVKEKSKHEIFEKVQALAIKTSKKMQETFVGNYKSAFTGEGLDYKETVYYNQGDSLRRVDWKNTAKTGKLMTKKFEETRKLRIQLIVDTSANLSTGIKELKKEKLIEALALVTFSALRNGDVIGLTFLGKNKNQIPYGSGRNHCYWILEEVLGEKFDGKKIDYNEEFRKLHSNGKGKAIYFLFSDFENEELIENFKKLNGRFDKIGAFIRDNLDQVEEKNGLIQISDPESDEKIEIDLKKFKEFKEEFEKEIKEKRRDLLKHGIGSLEIFDDKSSLDSFMEFFKSRQR